MLTLSYFRLFSVPLFILRHYFYYIFLRLHSFSSCLPFSIILIIAYRLFHTIRYYYYYFISLSFNPREPQWCAHFLPFRILYYFRHACLLDFAIIPDYFRCPIIDIPFCLRRFHFQLSPLISLFSFYAWITPLRWASFWFWFSIIILPFRFIIISIMHWFPLLSYF